MNPFFFSSLARPTLAGRLLARRADRSLAHRPVRVPRGGPPPRRLSRQLARLTLTAGLGLVAGLPAYAMNVNAATALELETLRGVGPKMAAVIIKERERGGQYLSLDDLAERVRGLGQKKLRALQAAGLSAGPKPGTAAPKPAAPRPRRPSAT